MIEVQIMPFWVFSKTMLKGEVNLMLLVGISLVFGAGVGIIIGLLFSLNIGLTIGIGAGIGLIIGTILSNSEK